MKAKWVLLACLCVSLWGVTPTWAGMGALSAEIERFILKQFPESQSHYWIVNKTEWSSEKELVVDVNTFVTTPAEPKQVEHRYLLLIVDGQVAGAQHIPLGAEVECHPEEEI
ncbi:MAG: hypothetical protein ACREI3_02820 [Nitrospirales bacterium]